MTRQKMHKYNYVKNQKWYKHQVAFCIMIDITTKNIHIMAAAQYHI